MNTVNIVVGIGLAAVIRMIIGMIWYSPSVFGAAWMKELGIKSADMKSKDAQLGMIGGLLSSLVIA